MKVKKKSGFSLLLKRSFLVAVLVLSFYYFCPRSALPDNAKIDLIIVYKSKRKLVVYSKEKIVKTYSIALGKNPIGDKQFEGDLKTPEGIYFIQDKNPNSGYYKNLGISYPNKKDIEKAKKIGKPVGGDIKIHGLKNKMGFIGKFHRWTDWTLGCIALTNDEVEELYNYVPIGTKIEILP
ncbi:murein L,D-transpeptidase family protein [Flavobacterium sp. J27]|uniref:L,D-transpeptidase family protein n=1 Tax=Flavobacterium sp. J27 TaxID=2060419 RepID=UPI001F11282B|nr:L,D-transpeptidase family protein [Flavobacterium sp. J27]